MVKLGWLLSNRSFIHRIFIT